MKSQQLSQGKLILLLLATVSLLIFVFPWSSTSFSTFTSKPVEICSHDGLRLHTQCVRRHMGEAVDLFMTFKNVVKECFSLLCNQTMLEFANGDESKFAYPPSPDVTSPLLITLGIGMDIEAELKWKLKYPNTRFLGADPFSHSGKVYEKIGEWHKVGVSGVDGVVKSSVQNHERHYESANLTTITLCTLMKRANLPESTVIDQLWIDNEGGEYSLLPQLTFTNSTITVCQMNVELHGPPDKYGLKDKAHFDEFVRNVFGKKSKFGVIKLFGVVGHNIKHWRLATINVVDGICRGRFDSSVISV